LTDPITLIESNNLLDFSNCDNFSI